MRLTPYIGAGSSWRACVRLALFTALLCNTSIMCQQEAQAVESIAKSVDYHVDPAWYEHCDKPAVGPRWITCNQMKQVIIIDLRAVAMKGPVLDKLLEPLQQLKSLTVLKLNLNRQLTGTLPPDLGSLSNLQELDLSNTGVAGVIPESWEGLRSLRTLSLMFTKVEGTIPSGVASLPSLQNIYVASTRLCGPVPNDSAHKVCQFNARSCSVTLPACPMTAHETPPRPPSLDALPHGSEVCTTSVNA